MQKGEQLYAGKAKTIYTTDNPEQVIMQFRNDASAFDGTKRASLDRKGLVNNYFNAFIMTYLTRHGIDCHFIECISDTESVVKSLDMIRVECVVRNYAAGSLCRRLGVEEGVTLTPPIFEFFYKDDSLHDPLINEDHIITFGWASAAEIAQMRQLTLRVNELLLDLFAEAGFLLVDFKLEFGRYQNKLVLGDELTPDGCRIWDIASRDKYDKDRFRQDLGDVIAFYEIVAQRLGIALPEA
jgi:phosphoribosylaminoimidazole-succinocarboxamide synthase